MRRALRLVKALQRPRGTQTLEAIDHDIIIVMETDHDRRHLTVTFQRLSHADFFLRLREPIALQPFIERLQRQRTNFV